MLNKYKNYLAVRLIVMTYVLIGLSSQTFGKINNDIKNIFPKIPFNIDGLNLCEFSSAYSHDRISYMREMIRLSREITRYPNNQTIDLINEFNILYEKNMDYARKGLGKNLEVSFKAFIEQYYTNLRPRTRKLEFKQNAIDIIIIGHYALAPSCNGQVQVSLELIEADGISTTFQATGPVQTVMSKLASKIFEKYQRTKFPTVVNMSNGHKLEIIGGPNGDISITKSLKEAQYICESLDARLPTLKEYEFINALGSWSGGISLADKAWALNYPYVYLYNGYRTPLLSIHFLKPQDIYYVCVR